MRNLLFFALVLLMMGFAVGAASQSGMSDMGSDNCEKVDPKALLKNEIRNDSIVGLVSDKDFIVYTSGHHGYIWSLLADVDSSYMVAIGSTRDSAVSVGSLPKDNPLLSWAFDSLPVKAENMTPVYRTEYFPIYTRLIVCSDSGDRIFGMDNAIGYEGPDSIAFNDKLGRLHYYMLWLAMEEYRDKMPTPK